MSDASSPSQFSSQPRPWKKWVIAICLVAVIAVLYVAFRPGTTPDPKVDSKADAAAAPGEDVIAAESQKMGAFLNGVETKPAVAGEGIPTEILEEMQRCLKAPELSADGLEVEAEVDPAAKASPAPVRYLRSEEALAEIEKELGPAITQGDLWTDWIVRLPEGMDRKVHLENVEDQGRIQQNLSVFQIDQSGKATRMQLTDAEEQNPDMGMISNMLNEGEILRKETSRYFMFASGERFELIELDGKPTEFEIVRGEVFFRCDKMESSDNCTCIR